VNVVIPQSVVVIGAAAFSYCGFLVDVTFDQNSQIQTIGYAAFMGSGIRRFDFPASVRMIEAVAFSSCGSLGDITLLPNSQPEIRGYAFRGTPLRAVTLPPGAVVDPRAFPAGTRVTRFP
jgi:hypothetical protein